MLEESRVGLLGLSPLGLISRLLREQVRPLYNQVNHIFCDHNYGPILSISKNGEKRVS
jgi:hypothetical protein